MSLSCLQTTSLILDKVTFGVVGMADSWTIVSTVQYDGEDVYMEGDNSTGKSYDLYTHLKTTKLPLSADMKKNDPLSIEEMTAAAEQFFPLFNVIHSRMPEGSRTKTHSKLWSLLPSSVTSYVQTNSSKQSHSHLDLIKMKIPDYVSLEMRMAELMSQQEASGFRFDMEAAVRVRTELQEEFDSLTQKITSTYLYVPGKVFTPKRADKKKDTLQVLL